jgi:hypothetical protein
MSELLKRKEKILFFHLNSLLLFQLTCLSLIDGHKEPDFFQVPIEVILIITRRKKHNQKLFVLHPRTASNYLNFIQLYN